MAEFLTPLCDLVNGELTTVDVASVELASHAHVPRLTELCLKQIRKDNIGTLK